VTVVIASSGYPASPRVGDPIEGLAEAATVEGVEILHAGTRTDSSGTLVSSGGRVLSVTAVGPDLGLARDRAYEAAAKVRLAGSHFRTDIGQDALLGRVHVPTS
jgi:phosphoribosylamine--glycine ligase